MKVARWHLAALTTLFLLCLSVVFARNMSSTAQNLGFSNLTLGITIEKDSFVQSEPVPVTLILSNQADQPVEGHTVLNFSANYIELLITRPDGTIQKFDNLSPIKAKIIADPRIIKQGETYQTKQLLNHNLDEIFPFTGRYQIQFVLYDRERREEIKSNVRTIDITVPEGLNLAAIDFIRSHKGTSRFFTGVDIFNDRQSLEALEEFVSRYGDSAYGDYAVYLLGQYYFLNKDDVKALRLFEKISRKERFIFADKIKDYLDKIKKRKRDKEKR